MLAVTRSFQPGASFANFNRTKCQQGLIKPIRKLLDTAPSSLESIVVVSCSDTGSRFSEEVREGRTPTIQCLMEAFPGEILSGRITPVLCENWGLNAGSATAINAGLSVAFEREVKQVLVWSPEIDLDGHMVTEMIEHHARYGLELTGYFRKGWWMRAQWMFAQNTIALWNAELLMALDGFSPACNGDGTTTVTTRDFGDVPLAGMEDIEAYFRAAQHRGSFPRWGMVGKRHPRRWDLARKLPGTEEYDNNTKKIARQGHVIEAWAKRHFPGQHVNEVLANVMRASEFA